MANSTQNTSGGIGFVGLLMILFIALKLTGFIDWSWLWVLSPIWISFSVVFGLLALFLVGHVGFNVLKSFIK